MRNLWFKISLIVCFSLLSVSTFAQSKGDNSLLLQPRCLVDMNTAGLLERGSFAIATEHMADGVIILKVDVGLFKQINIGISYGSSNFLGRGELDFYDYPGVSVKIRAIPEEFAFPAILLGFDSQGKGVYFRDGEYKTRYEIKSPGFYIVASKNMNMLGNLGLHAGLNYSLETKDNNKNMNLTFGADKSLGEMFYIVGEYSFAFNDDIKSLNRGFLNAGIRWVVADGFTLGFDFRNLLGNKTDLNYVDRGIRIEFSRMIF